MAVALLTVPVLSSPLGAQSTPYVPGDDAAYGDLDALVASGLVRELILGERPYSRAAFARYVAEAMDRTADGQVTLTARVEEALTRLSALFGDDSDRGGAWARPRRVDAELTGASSPSRDLRTGADGSIDGDLNPLLQRNEGRRLVDGLTTALEGVVDLQPGWIAGQLRTRVTLEAPAGPTGVDASATLLDAYARGVVGPISLEAGRGHVSLGFGADGGPLLSNNARGLDMLRMSADRPVRLPGPLSALGLWQASALVADMGSNRDVPGSALTLFRLSGRPSRFVEFGFSYLNLQGGDGSPEASLREHLHDIFFFWTDGGYFQISDKVAGADLAVSIPAARSRLFVNVLTTDDRGRFSQPAGGLWEDAIWLAGGSVSGIGPDGRFDAHVEWRHSGARAHTHHQFTSGVTLDRLVLGDPLGPNAAGVGMGVDWTGPTSRISIEGAWERYSGDDFGWGLLAGGGPWDFDWFLVADNPDEIRKRLTVDWTRLAPVGGVEPSVRIGYEHVSRFDYGAASRSNLLLQVRAGYVW